MHEELGRHDVQPLADVLTHALHRLATVRRRAVGVFGLVMVFDPAQMIGQRLATRPALGRSIGRCSVLAARLLQLRQQACLVLGQRLLEEGALLGAHRLGLGTEAPRLVACQLERELLDALLLELVVAGQALDALLALLNVSVLFAQPGEYFRCQRGHGFGR